MIAILFSAFLFSPNNKTILGEKDKHTQPPSPLGSLLSAVDYRFSGAVWYILELYWVWFKKKKDPGLFEIELQPYFMPPIKKKRK